MHRAGSSNWKIYLHNFQQITKLKILIKAGRSPYIQMPFWPRTPGIIFLTIKKYSLQQEPHRKSMGLPRILTAIDELLVMRNLSSHKQTTIHSYHMIIILWSKHKLIITWWCPPHFNNLWINNQMINLLPLIVNLTSFSNSNKCNMILLLCHKFNHRYLIHLTIIIVLKRARHLLLV